MVTKLSSVMVAMVCLLGLTAASFGDILPMLAGPSASGTFRDDYTAVGSNLPSVRVT